MKGFSFPLILAFSLKSFMHLLCERRGVPMKVALLPSLDDCIALMRGGFPIIIKAHAPEAIEYLGVFSEPNIEVAE